MSRTTTHEPPFTLGEKLRWALFRILEHFSKNDPLVVDRVTADTLAPDKKKVIWIFASTIGELNAIRPLLKSLLASEPDSAFVFISDHEHYKEAYLAQYPDTVFFPSKGASADAQQLARMLPPSRLIIAEIPCLLSDAPCRFSYAFLRAAKKQGAMIAVVNGWLYGQEPSCRLDRWEQRLLLRNYLHLIDAAGVQTQAVADQMVAAGLDPAKAVVTGNMKFDDIGSAEWSYKEARSPTALRALMASDRPVLVAGCIKKPPEQQLVVKAFLKVLAEVPEAIMVIAPRHPEIEKNLELLSSELAAANITYVFRSKTGDTPPDDRTQCLVLDTMGELKDFYAIATVAHVGADHNVLEPLGFDKPVTTVSAWSRQFPNFPIFESLKTLGAVITADSHELLGDRWINWLRSPEAVAAQREKLHGVLLESAGATAKTVQMFSGQ